MMLTALSVYLPFHLAAYCQHNCCPSLSHPIYLSSPLCSQSSMRRYHRTLLRLSCIVFTMFTSFIHGYKYSTPSYNTHLHSKGVLISTTTCPRIIFLFFYDYSNIMPGHNHSFHDTFPEVGLCIRETFLSWCCPVKDKDSIEDSIEW